MGNGGPRKGAAASSCTYISHLDSISRTGIPTPTATGHGCNYCDTAAEITGRLAGTFTDPEGKLHVDVRLCLTWEPRDRVGDHGCDLTSSVMFVDGVAYAV